MKRTALPLIVAAVMSVAAAATAQTTTQGSDQSASEEREVRGRAQLMLPNEVVLATDSGLMRFAITDETQQPLDIATGDYVDLLYRTEAGGGSTIIRVGERPEAPTENAVTTAQASQGGAAEGGTLAASPLPFVGLIGALSRLEPIHK